MLGRGWARLVADDGRLAAVPGGPAGLRLQPRLRLAVLRRAGARQDLPDRRRPQRASACRCTCSSRSRSTSGSAGTSACGGEMPTTWVQEHFHPGTSIPLVGVLVSLVYCSHFLVMPTVAVVLWIRNRPRFRIWMRMVIALAVAGVATYFLYPMAPPWLADSGGVFPGPPVGRYTSEGFDLIGLHMVGGCSARGSTSSTRSPPCRRCTRRTRRSRPASSGSARRWWQKALLALLPARDGLLPALRRRALRRRRARRGGLRPGVIAALASAAPPTDPPRGRRTRPHW